MYLRSLGKARRIMFIKDIDSTYTAATHFNPNPYILIVIWFIENLFVCTNKS